MRCAAATQGRPLRAHPWAVLKKPFGLHLVAHSATDPACGGMADTRLRRATGETSPWQENVCPTAILLRRECEAGICRVIGVLAAAGRHRPPADKFTPPLQMDYGRMRFNVGGPFMAPGGGDKRGE